MNLARNTFNVLTSYNPFWDKNFKYFFFIRMQDPYSRMMDPSVAAAAMGVHPAAAAAAHHAHAMHHHQVTTL